MPVILGRCPYSLTVKHQGEDQPVSESNAITRETGTVAVIDQTGKHHHFLADGWYAAENGYLEVNKDGKPVATFGPGFLGVYKVEARGEAPVIKAG